MRITGHTIAFEGGPAFYLANGIDAPLKVTAHCSDGPDVESYYTLIVRRVKCNVIAQTPHCPLPIANHPPTSPG